MIELKSGVSFVLPFVNQYSFQPEKRKENLNQFSLRGKKNIFKDTCSSNI